MKVIPITYPFLFSDCLLSNQIPEVLKDCRPSTEGRLHLYRINIEPVEQTELSFGTGSSCLGILTAKPLPSVRTHGAGEACLLYTITCFFFPVDSYQFSPSIPNHVKFMSR